MNDELKKELEKALFNVRAWTQRALKLQNQLNAATAKPKPRGRKGGRKAKLTGEALQKAIELFEQQTPIEKIANILDVSERTVARHVKKRNAHVCPL